MEPHIATRKLRLATLLENDLFVRLPRGVTAARTKLAVQRWQSVHVLSTLQTFITWPPSPGRATCLVQERSVFSVIVAGTTEQFLFFFTSVCWGSGVGKNSCAAVLLLCMFCLEQTSMSSVWYLSNVVMVCSVCFFIWHTQSSWGGWVPLNVFPLLVSHHFYTMKLNLRRAEFMWQNGSLQLKRYCMKLPPGRMFSWLTCRVLW